MTRPAARRGDMHQCPTHGPSPVAGLDSLTVLVNGAPAARRGDLADCPSGGDAIVEGSPTVLFAGQPAARVNEKCAHGGTVVTGSPNVLIGNPPVGPDGRAIQIPAECAFLKDFGGIGSGEKLDRLRDRDASSPPVPVSVTIPGDSTPTPMLKRNVWIRGHKVSVYEPAGSPPAGTWWPSGDSVTKGLDTLSDEQLRNTKEVYVVPHAGRPTDSGALPVADYGSKPGVVRLYPRNSVHPQSDIDWTLQHETGHGYSLNEAWAMDPAKRDAWKKAIADDERSITRYGDINEVEDFAEFMILYADVLGTPCEASMRALFPNRCREMDKLFPHGLPAHNPSGGRGAY